MTCRAHALRTGLILSTLLSTVAFAQGGATEASTGPTPGALVGDAHAGLGVALVSSPESSTGIGGGLQYGAGGAIGFQLSPRVAPVLMVDFGALLAESGDPTPFVLSAGPGVKLALGDLDLTAGAVFKLVTSTTPTLIGGGVQLRAAYLFAHRSVGPYLQLEGDELRSGYQLFSAALGVQVDFP